MKILLASPEQHSLTGQPMYVKNLAQGLRELGHEVTCSESPSGDYDIAVLNDHFPEALGKFTAKKIFNICHSKYEGDRPILDKQEKRIYKYLVPRQEIADYWQINADILPIPINLERWQKKLAEHSNYRIIAPCTIDHLRLPMLQDLCARANKECSVWIVGKDCGALSFLNLNPYVKVFYETPKIEDLMKECDEVAGIYIGTVTLEAWAMGLKTSVYDENGNWQYIDKPEDFSKYNYLEVAKQLLNL